MQLPPVTEIKPLETRAPQAPKPAAEPVSLDHVLKESGLQLVETKAAAAVQAPPTPEPQFVPAKRERRAPPPGFDQPMQQVETQKKEG